MNLYCKIFLDADASYDDLVAQLQQIIGGVREYHSLSTDLCTVDVRRNDDFDRSRKSGADGFLYYRYFLDVEPTQPIQRERYVSFIKNILSRLRDRGTKCVAACDFEDELAD
jgi:hypothetical protein